MKYFLQICIACLCMLGFAHSTAQAQAVLDRITLYNQPIIALTAPNHPAGSFTNIPTNTTITLRFDQNIFKIGGASFGTNEVVTSFFTLNDGAAVLFAATINGRVVTITPSAELRSSRVHTVTLLAGFVEDNPTSIPNVTQTVEFETAILITLTAPSLVLCRNGIPKVLGNIVITEGSSASFGQGTGQTFEMNAPAGFEFVAGVGSIVTSGTDISNAIINVATTLITLTYDVNSAYANTNIITIQNVQVKWIPGTGTGLLVRTGGNAIQAGNRTNQSKTHATFTSLALPTTTPTPANYLLASGFSLTTNLAPAFSVPAGFRARFYATNTTTLLYTSGDATFTGLINVTPTNLGYASNTTLGATQFFMTIVTAASTDPNACETAQVPFTITVGNIPQMASMSLFSANNFNLPTNTTILLPATYKIPTNTSIILDFNEPIRTYLGGIAFTDATITTIFTNNVIETVSALPVVGITATIVGQRVTITSPELKAATSYTIRLPINSCQNVLNTPNALQTIQFTTADAVITTPTPALALCRNSIPQVLGDIVFTEGSNTSFGEGTNQLFEMNAPIGFEFVAGTGNVVTTGSDVSGANLFVTPTKITLLYSVNSAYANVNVITLQNIQVVWTFGTAAGTLVRAATSNANQANNGIAITYADLTSVAVPTAPTLPVTFTSGNLNVCSGFLLTNTTNFTVISGSVANFYNTMNTLIHTETAIGTNVSVSLGDLGYTSSTTLGTLQFSMGQVVSGCESTRTSFTITNNPLPSVTLINGATSFCQGDAVTFDAVGTTPVSYQFQLSQISPVASGFASVSSTSSYTASSLTAGTYQLRVRATDAVTGCSSFSSISGVSFTVTASPPVVTFVWINSTAYSDAPVAVDLFDVSGVSPFGTFGGRVGTLFNQVGGVYSGTGVVAGKFYPNAAGVGTHTITYTYTSGVCVASAIVTFTVFSNNNPILNLATTYCIESGVSGILTPSVAVGGGTDAFEPNTFMNPGFYSTFTHLDAWFTFPSFPGFNPGVVWTPTGGTAPLPGSGFPRPLGNYTFDPNAPAVLALFGPADSFVNVILTIATFVPSVSPQPFNTLFCNYHTQTVRVYRVLPASMSVNLANLQAFCRTDADFVINPFINGVVPPAGSTSIMEYKLQSDPTFAPFPTTNTIEPSALAAGTYDMRFTYLSPQGCTKSIIRNFIIRDNPAPAFAIRNNLLVDITSTCTNAGNIRLRNLTSSNLGISFFTVSKAPGFSISYSVGSGPFFGVIMPLSDLVGAGVYNITLTVTNGACATTTAVQTLTVVETPLADFSFAPLVPLPIINTLSICETANSLTLYPNSASLPVGSGYFNIKKTTGGALGKNFANGISSFDPTSTDFDVSSGTGVGTYEIRYIYTTTTGACVGMSVPKLLTIIEKPNLTLNLSAFEVCRVAVMPNIIILPTWSNQGLNPFIVANAVTRIYASNGTTLLQTLTGAAATTFNPNSLVTSPAIITTFQIEYQYTDNNGCVGIAPRKNLSVNPLPVPTITFSGASSFCLAGGNTANFTVNATSGNPFSGLKGRITIRSNPASTPATPAFSTMLATGVNTFNVSSLNVGEYFVDYTYTDYTSPNTCAVTVTCPTLLIYNHYPAPDFTYPGGVSSYAICADLTNLILTPSLNIGNYGVDASIIPTSGVYIIEKGGVFFTSFSGANNFNPNMLIVNVPGGGVGTYTIQYTYTTARLCSGEGFRKTLVINPLPVLTAVLSPIEICNIATKASVTLTPTWASGAIITTNGFIKIYANNGTTLLATLPNGTNTIDLNLPMFAALVGTISPTAITNFKVEYNYLDNNGCLGASPQQNLAINPLPVPTIAFSSVSDFCFEDGLTASFTVNASGVNVPPFNLANGKISIRSATTVPVTVALPATTLADGVISFVPTTIPFGGGLINALGEYFIDYTYTDTKGCPQTVTCPTRLKIRSKMLPTFRFPLGNTDFAICETVTSLALTPSLPSPVVYGADGTVVNTRGTYTFTKGPFTATFTGTAIGTTDVFNPQTLLRNAPLGGVGTYFVTYRYNSLLGCLGTSVSVQTLTINELPALTFTLSSDNICNYFGTLAVPINPSVTLTPTWVNQGTNTFEAFRGKINIYNAANAKITLPNGQNIITRDFIGSSFAISSTAVTTFQIEYEYTDDKGCNNISARTPLYINPLPVPTIAFTSALPSASNFCLGSGGIASFALNATGVGVAPFNLSNGVITIRNTFYNLTLAAGVTSFNVSTLATALPVGEYFIDYTYTDTKSCAVTVTCATNLKINTLPLVSFRFPTNATDYSICENVTSLTLTPTLANSTAFGVDASLNVAGGQYIITKGTFNWTVTATNTFNPKTLLFDAVGGGAGVYQVVYRYRTALICDGFSTVSDPLQTLTIFPLPAPTFSFVGGDSDFCANESNVNVIPLISGLAPVSPANGFFTITKTAPVAGLPVAQSGGNNQFSIATLITNSGLGTYNIFYTYLDVTGCTNTTAPQTFNIIPLPITSLSFPATVAFPSGDNSFCANETNAIVNINYAGVLSLTESIITISKGTFSLVLNPGAVSFNPLFLSSNAAAGIGIYNITHTYTDGNGCENTTVPITFNIYALPEPTFTFQTATLPAPNLSICANITSVTLIPNISNTTDYGVGAFANALGYFTIRKGGLLVTQLPNGVNTFNPNDPTLLLTSSAGGLVGTYEITYTYKTANGCEQTTLGSDNFVINPLPLSNFTFVATSVAELNVAGDIARVCASFANNIILDVIAPIGVAGTYVVEIQEIVTSPTPTPALIQLTSLSISSTDLGILPTTSTIREFQIRLRYTNVNGCVATSTPKILRVVPVPATIFTTGNQKCVGIPVTFNGTSPTQATDVAVSYVWNFDDGVTETNTIATTTHSFMAARSYTVSLTITSALGCSKTFIQNVVIGNIPVASFTTAAFCEGSATTFTSTSTLIGTGNIATYAWNFGDGSAVFTSASPTTTHLYTTPDKYTATLTITTDNLCTDIFSRDVFIFPRITPTAAAPYKENFDNVASDKTWFANGLIKSTINPTQDITGFSWKRGVPTGAKINASATTGGAWSTTGNANTFYPNERSYVESPCFNFTDPTLTKPVISMKIWYDTDRGGDGAVLYSSVNDGVTWQVVGTINEGLEWYNTAGIIAQPGGQAVVNAWTGNTLTTYKIAKFNLDQFRGQASVRFRVAFGSNADNPVGTAFDGFAFDDVFIGNRNRISLLEHFTNASSSEANTENTFINNFPSVGAQNEIYNIQYHTNVPGADPMNADNTADPSARALFYGVSQVPRTAIDGTIENRKFSEWGAPVYNKRTLETSPFELSVDFTSTTQLLRFKANVKALEPFTRRVILQTAVVEQEILGTAFTTGNFGGLTFKNVVKKMIPNAAGTLIAQTWLQNTQFQTGELTWSPTNVYNGNKLVLVVFVQDEVTKEIYQAGFFNITTNIIGQNPTTALDPQTQANLLDNEFVVYPNPAQNEVFTGFRQETSEDFKVVIFDSYGKRVDDYSLPKGNKGLLLNTEKYASGMYFVEITGKNNVKARKKLVIAR